MKRHIILAFGALVTGFSAYAQSEATPSDSIPYTEYDELDEIVVEVQKPVMHTDGATLTYNVDEDPAADSSSAMDMLKKVPQVSVDADGNIRLNGSDAFKFQVNGLDNPMFKQYASQILPSMPASSIVKIEVITEPGAKEDAEGSAGIINIITERKQSKDGYSGSVTLQAANRTLTPSLYGILKKDKVTLSANVYYQWGFSPQKGEQESEATYTQTGQTLKSVTGQSAKHQVVGGNINFSWEPNNDNLFTAGANLFYIDATLGSLYNRSYMYGDGMSPLWHFSQDGNGLFKIMNVSANASFRHNFGREGNSLILSYLFNFGKTNLAIDRSYTELFNYTPDFRSESQKGKSFDRGHTAQIDYANDFNSEHHRLEVGAKGIFRHNSAISRYYYGETPQQLQLFPDLDSRIMQPQNIYAGYASYIGTFGQLGVTAGLRYEHTYMGITDHTDPRQSFRNRLNDWVPNAALTWNLSDVSNFRLAYQMRISRPSIQQVNPFELSFSPYEIRTGNPDLTSEHNHIVSLKYSAFGRVFGGTVGLEYNTADNAISGFTYLRQQDGINAIVTSYANIGKKQDIALTGFLNWSVIRNMNLTINGRLAYNTLKAPAEGFSNHGWSGNIGANWNYSVASVWKFSAYGAWNSRTLDVQGYSSGYYYYGISAARDFLADRSLTLSVSANNFLQKSMTFKGYTRTPNVIYDNTARSLSAWNVGVSLTWKFGSLSTQVKKTGVELKNDDINQSSNKGQGSSI